MLRLDGGNMRLGSAACRLRGEHDGGAMCIIGTDVSTCMTA